MSKRRLRNSIDESTQTSFTEPKCTNNGADEYFDSMADAWDNDGGMENAEGGRENNVNDDIPHENGEVVSAREAVDRAAEALAAIPNMAVIPNGADPTAALMAQMLHTMQLQYAQARLDDK